LGLAPWRPVGRARYYYTEQEVTAPARANGTARTVVEFVIKQINLRLKTLAQNRNWKVYSLEGLYRDKGKLYEPFYD
jgi:hypothetical protein